MIDNRYKCLLFSGKLITNGIEIYKSCQEAARGLGNPKLYGHISACVKGDRKTSGGFKWYEVSLQEYIESLENIGNESIQAKSYRRIKKIAEGLYESTNNVT